MKNRYFWVGTALALILGLVSLGFAREAKQKDGSEKKITKQDVPAAVMTAFKSAYPAAKIVGTNRETEDSTTFFEIESRDGKVQRDVLYLADGAVKEIEEGIAKADLPAAIKDAIAKEYPKGIIQKGEKITRDTMMHYELIVKKGKDRMEVVLDETGKIVKSETLTGQEEKEDKAEGKK